LDVYNIFEKLKLADAHYETGIMMLPSCSRPHPPPAAPTRSSYSSSKAKAVHLVAPILPSCNYYGNPTYKANECNIPSEDFFCDYCGKEGHQEVVYFAKFRNQNQLRLPWQNLPASFTAPQPKPRHLNLPLMLSPPKVIPVKMLRRRSIMLTKGRCFKPMPLKFKFCKMNSNH
jgi:hypothetical protein